MANIPQALANNMKFENPIDHSILRELGIQTLLFPGHKEGHVIFYNLDKGGFALCR
jgi:hypothetical protein